MKQTTFDQKMQNQKENSDLNPSLCKREESSEPRVITEKIPSRNLAPLLPNDDENCAANTIANRAIATEKLNMVRSRATSAQAWFSELAREMGAGLQSLKELMTENEETDCRSNQDHYSNNEPFFSWTSQKSDEEIRRFQDSPAQVLHNFSGSKRSS
jgi:hypothetical protein